MQPEIPEFLKPAAPFFCDWCFYKGRVYFAQLNYERSIAEQKPVIQLHYCATAAFNNNLIEHIVIYRAKDFQQYKPTQNR